jgi:hypothetical protein
MKPSLRVFLLAFLLAPTLLAQTQTVTITRLTAGTYTVSSPAGTQLVNVTPLGSDSYSFMSSDGSSTVVTLAPGMYTLTSSSGANLGTTYIYSLGNGLYSFSNPTTGTTGTIQSVPSAPPPPLPALAIQPVQQPNLIGMYATAVYLCQARGAAIYKVRRQYKCLSPDEARSVADMEQSKAFAKEKARRQKLLEKCQKQGRVLNADWNGCMLPRVRN